MATATVGVSPVRGPRINQNLYVGQAGIRSIQAAVNYAAADGGIFVVVIPFGYNSADLISTVVNGSTSIILSDQRGYNGQTYMWQGGAYIPANFTQLGGMTVHGPLTPRVSSMLLGVDVFGSGIIESCGPDPSTNGDLLLRVSASDGSNIVNVLQCEGNGNGRFWNNLDVLGGITALGLVGAQANALLLQGGFGGSATIIAGCGPNPVTNGEILLRVCASDGSSTQNVLQCLGDGDGKFWSNLIVARNLTVSGDTQLNTCEVAGSPVRTFANTPAAAPFPPAGIGVSTGAAWGASIDPTTLQAKLSLTTTGISGPATLIGNTINIPQYTAPAQVYPGAGIGVSTGAGWGASIDPATLQGKLNLTTTGSSGPATLVGNTLNIPQYAGGAGMVYPGAGIGVSTGTGWGASIDPATLQAKLSLTTTGISGPATLIGNTINIPQYTAPAQVYPGAGIPVSTGSAWGTSIAAANIPLLNAANTFTANQTLASASITGAATVGGTLGATGRITATGGILISGVLSIDSRAKGATINADPTNMFINSAAAGGSIYFNWDFGSGVHFGNGASAEVAGIDNAGNAHFNGSITAGSKTFLITHPLDAKKDLVHGCLEGPEHSVFYRGEAKLKKGSATVELPDYFEALTFDDDRTVLLTVIVDDAKPVFGGQVAAGRIKGGKFKIYSTDQSATVAWEVKAARRMDAGRLQVVRDKIKTATGANA